MIKTVEGFKDYIEEHFGPVDNLGLLAELTSTVEGLMDQPGAILYTAVVNAVDEMTGLLRDVVAGLHAQDGLPDDPDDLDDLDALAEGDDLTAEELADDRCVECHEPILFSDRVQVVPCGRVHAGCYEDHCDTCLNCGAVEQLAPR